MMMPMFYVSGGAIVSYPLYVENDYTLPAIDTTTWHTINSATLTAGGIFMCHFAIEYAGALGVAPHVTRLNCVADNAGGTGTGHDQIPPNLTGFNGQQAAHCFAAIADGSPVGWEVNSGSSSARRASHVGTVVINVGGVDTTLLIQLLDRTTAVQSGRCGLVVRKLN